MPSNKTKRKVTVKEGGEAAFALLKLTVAAADAFPPLKSAAGGALHIVDLVKKFKSHEKEWASFGNYVQNTIGCVIDSLPGAKQPREDLKRNVERLRDVLVNIQGKITSIQSEGRMKRFWAFIKDPETITALRQDLGDALTVFHLGSAITTGLDTAKFLEGVKTEETVKRAVQNLMPTVVPILSDYDVEKRNSLVGELSSIVGKCALKHEDCQRNRSGCRSAGRWLLQHSMYLKWHSNQHGLLRMTGEPGAGKTILASVVIDVLRHSIGQFTRGHSTRRPGVEVVAFHYCCWDDASTCDPMTFLGTLLHQLIEGLPPGSAALLNLGKDVNRSLRQITTITDVIIKLADEFSKVYFVLDAFDECDEGSRRCLLPSLRKLKDHILVMIVSRNIPDVRDWFKQELLIQLRPQDVQADIVEFLSKTVCPLDGGGDPDNIRLILPTEDLCQKIRQELSDGAKGIFLWVKLQVEHLKDHTLHDYMLEAVGELPPGLGETFSRSINSIKKLPVRTSRQCIGALYWLAFTRVPLTCSELVEAVAIGDMEDTWDTARVLPDPVAIADKCANLISVRKGNSNLVQLYHPSVKDFLVQCPELFADIPQFLVARDCLKYLSLIPSRLPNLFVHASQNFVYYLRRLFQHNKDLQGLFITVATSVVARDVLGHYKFFSNYECVSGCVIHIAVALHLSEILQGLLQITWPARNYLDHNGCTPLHHAECLKCMQILINSKIFNVNVINMDGETALHRLALLATRAPPADGIKIGSDELGLALKQRQKVEIRCEEERNSLEEIALLLIDNGADVRLRDNKGRTPLHILPVYNPKLVDHLATSDTIDAVDLQGRVPLTSLLVDFTLQRFPMHHLMEMFRIIMEKNPNVDIPDIAGCTPLHHAVVLDNLSIEMFVKLRDAKGGCSAARATNNRRQTPLHLAAISNKCSIGIFSNLLAVSGAIIHEVDLEGRTALHYACQFHSPEKVELLLLAGAHEDVLVSDVDRRTPLHFATKYRASMQVIISLMEHTGNSPVWHIPDGRGRTAFDYALGGAVVIIGKQEISDFRKVSPSTITASLRRTLLHIACDWPLTFGSRFRHSRTERIRTFLCMGGDKTVGAVDQNGQTAIHLAVMSRVPVNVLLSLLDNKFEKTTLLAIDRLGRTALHYACMSTPRTRKSRKSNDDSLVSTLILKGPASHIAASDTYLRQTPIHVAAICASATTLKLLLKKLQDTGAIHNVDVMGRTALHYACDPASEPGWLEKVKVLLDYGAGEDTGVPDYKMQTPLHLAAILESSEVLTTLLASNDKAVNFCDLKRRTPLHYVCMRWKPGSEKISLLLKHGAGSSVGIHDLPTGRTPVHLAVISGSPAEDLESLLALRPSPVRMADNFGRTPLHYACHGRLGLDSIQRAKRVSLLLKCGAQPHVIWPDARGQTPIDIATSTCASTEILTILSANKPGVGVIESTVRSAKRDSSLSREIVPYRRATHASEQIKREKTGRTAPVCAVTS